VSGETGTNTGPDTSTDANANTGDDANKGTDKVGAGTDDKGTGTDDKAKKDGGEDTTGLKKALAETRKERDALLKAQRDAELAKLPELERAKAQVDELTKENEKLSIENRRYKVGMKLGLPWSLAKRLTGDTDEEMEADGADLVKEYKGDGKKVVDDPANKKKTPPNDAKRTGGSAGPGMNDILRALRRG
jgi:hypothetical protein